MSTFTPQVIAQRTKVSMAAVVVLGFALLCQAIAVVTPGWLCAPDVVIGLFIYCGALTPEFSTRSTGDCEPLKLQVSSDSLQACRVLSVLSAAVILAACLLCCVHLWLVVRHEKIHHVLVTACVSLGLVAVIVSLVVSVVFAASTKPTMPSKDGKDRYDLFYSYALYVAGGLFAILGAGLTVGSAKSLTRLLLV